MTEANIAFEDHTPDIGLANGTTLSEDQFTITRRLSAGGFGITYLAQDNTLGRTIVIKECFPEDLCTRVHKAVTVRSAAHGETYNAIVRTFLHEARSLAKLRHPNIVGVHRAFEENNTAYMALDLIDGHDLLDILDAQAGPLPSPEVVKEMLIQLLRAIETIHDHDLLHRDISPDNIIIEKTGVPVLIDFGAARADASRRTRAISSLVVVKDGYSPPEFYVAGSTQTPSSDLYALGATFYHVLTGEAPPNSQIRMAEIAAQKPDPCVPLKGRIKGYDPVFLDAIDKAMNVIPNKRMQTAHAWHALIASHVSKVVQVSPAVTQAPAKPVTQDLERLLTRMIKETNKDVEQSKNIAPPPAPEKEAAPKQTPKPNWLAEFNAESKRKEDTSQRLARPTPETPPSRRARPKPIRTKSEDAPATPTSRAKTRILTAQKPASRPVAVATSRPVTKKAPQPVMAAQSKPATNDEIDLMVPSYVDPHGIEPLVKYLVTGVMIGLAVIFLYPNLI